MNTTLSARERLRAFQEKYHAVAKKSLGQNFLVSDFVIQKIIQTTVVTKPQMLIEIGPGTGALTDILKTLNIPLQLIELDSFFAQYWREQGQNVIEKDALQLDWSPLLQNSDTECKVLVSNLPYQISSSIVIDRSLDEMGFSYMILMFQKEVAQRIRAKPKTSEYGMLSVIAQTFWQINTVADAGAADFSPAPKVSSRVLLFSRTLKNREKNIKHPQLYLILIKSAFSQRRKLLKSNLKSMLHQYSASEEKFLDWLQNKGHTVTARAEELSVDDFVDLYSFLCQKP